MRKGGIRGHGLRQGDAINHHRGWGRCGAFAGFARLAGPAAADPGRSCPFRAPLLGRGVDATGTDQHRNRRKIIDGKGGDLHQGRLPQHRLPAGLRDRHRDLVPPGAALTPLGAAQALASRLAVIVGLAINIGLAVSVGLAIDSSLAINIGLGVGVGLAVGTG